MKGIIYLLIHKSRSHRYLSFVNRCPPFLYLKVKFNKVDVLLDVLSVIKFLASY